MGCVPSCLVCSKNRSSQDSDALESEWEREERLKAERKMRLKADRLIRDAQQIRSAARAGKAEQRPTRNVEGRYPPVRLRSKMLTLLDIHDHQCCSRVARVSCVAAL